MIEMVLAKTGDLVFDYDHRQLCSHVDPKHDAKLWVDRRLGELDQSECIIVLGLGCGYHILELMSRLPQAKVFVLEAKKEIIEACMKVHGLDFAKLNVRIINSTHELQQSVWLDQALQAPYRILIHMPSYFISEGVYGDVHRLLLARQWSSLTWLWQKRFGGHLIQQLQPIDSDGAELLSIKNLDQVINQSDIKGKSKSWMVFKALRELVT